VSTNLQSLDSNLVSIIKSFIIIIIISIIMGNRPFKPNFFLKSLVHL